MTHLLSSSLKMHGLCHTLRANGAAQPLLGRVRTSPDQNWLELLA